MAFSESHAVSSPVDSFSAFVLSEIFPFINFVFVSFDLPKTWNNRDVKIIKLKILLKLFEN